MKPRRRLFATRVSLPFLTAIVALFAASHAGAQIRTWIPTASVTNGAWGTTTNWSGGDVPDTNLEIASFSVDFTGSAPTFALGANRTVNGVIYNDTGTTGDVVGTIVAGSTLTLGGTAPKITTQNSLTINSILSWGASGFTKDGATVGLTLSGVNTGTGPVALSAGTLRATTSADALGTGAATLSLAAGTTLQLANNTGLNFARNTTVAGNTTITSDRTSAGAGVTHTLGTLGIGAQTLTVTRGSNATSGTGGITFGATTLSGAANFAPGANSLLTVAATGLGTNTMTKSGTGSMSGTGVVSGSKAAGSNAISITGGLLTLSGANTFSGNIAVDGASSVFAMAGGTYTTTAPYGRAGNLYKQLLLTNGGIFRLNSGTFNNQVPDGTNTAEGIIFNIGTGGGTLDVASGATLIIDDGATVLGTGTTASQIQGAGDLTKTGLGTFSTDDSTGYAGTITVTEGLLQAASGNAFGANTAGTTIQSGAALNVNGVTMTNAEPLTINGTGLAAAPAGALTSSTGNATWAGPITLGSNTTIGGGAGGLTVSSTIDLGANALTLNQVGVNTLTNGVISGSGNVVVTGSGAGVASLSGANTFTGGVSLNSGSFAVGISSTGTAGNPTDGPFGAGTAPLILNGSQVRCGTGGPFSVGNVVTLAADTTFFTAGSEKTLTFTGPVTLSGGNRTLTSDVGNTVAGTTVIFNGAIGEDVAGRSFTKAGTGNLVLGGTNAYTGATSVNAGSLILTGSLDPASALSVSPTVAGGATFSLASGTANPVNSAAALTLDSTTGPATVGFDLGANTAASDSITTSATATTAGTVNIAVQALAGFGSSATYDLINAAGGLSGATYVLTNAPGGFNYSLTTTGTLVQLGVTPATAGDRYWRGNIDNSWSSLSGSNSNWFNDAAGSTNAQTSPGAGETVNFSTVNATNAAGVIATTLDNNFTVNDLVFGSDPNGVTSVTIGGGFTPAGVPGVLSIAPASSVDGLLVGSNAGNVTISAPVLLGAAQTWSVDGTGANGSALTVSGALSGSGPVTLNGLVTLSAANGTSTHSGATTVTNGSILLSGATNSFSASTAVTVDSTGIVTLNGFSNTVASLAGTGTLQNNHASTGATLTVGDATDSTFGGVLQNGAGGALGLTKTGAGVLTLSGVNTYTGATTITEGTIVQGAAGALPTGTALTVNGTSLFDLNGADASVATLGGVATGIVTDNAAGSGTSTLSITAAGSSAVNINDGTTRDVALRVTNGNGSFLLTNGLNTFSGGIVLTNSLSGTRMSPGTITAGAYGSGAITIGESPSDKAGILFATAGQTLANPIIFNTALGTDRVGIRADAAVTLSGVITANLAPATFTSNSALAGAFTLTNQVTGSSGLVLDITSLSAAATSFLVTLNNATINPNNYQGDTIVNFNAASGKSATLEVAAADQIPNGVNAGNVFVNSNSTGVGLLRLAGVSETINGLNGSGNVESTIASATLTLGDNNATASHSGAISNTGGTLSVTKIGSGIQTLGGASTFDGVINVTGGLVAFPSSPATAGPLGNSTVVNLSGGGISFTSAGANTLNRTVAILGSTGTVDVANATGALTFAATSTGGDLVKTGPGAALLTGITELNLAANGAGVVVSAGSLQAGFGGTDVATVAVGATGNLNLADSAAETVTLENSSGALTLNGGAQLGFDLIGAGNDSIAVAAGGSAVTSGTVTLNFFGTPTAGTFNLLTADSGLAGATYALGVAPNGFNYTINASDTVVSVTVSPYIPNFWRGGQDLSWNTLGAATANWTTDAAGTIDATSTPVLADTVLFSATGAPTVSNAINTTLDAAFTVDSLQFTNVPAGVTDVSIAPGTGGSLTLTPLSTSGGIRVLAGGGNALISAPLTIGAAQTWDVDPTGSLTISGDTVFNGNVIKSNTGALTLSGTNSGTGAITLAGGTLNLNNTAGLGSGLFTIGAGTTLNTPAGAIALANNNTQVWNGDFTFTGANTLDLGTGTVTLGNSLTLNTPGSTLTVGGSIGDGGNDRGLAKVGAGMLVLNGANSHGGLTSITGGVLRITNATALGSVAAGTTQSGTSALELDGSGGAVAVGDEPLTINGGGISNSGALRNIAGNNSYGGAVTMAAQSRINSDSGTLTLSNSAAVTSSGLALVAGGAGNTTISGAITLGTGGLIKDGAGILTLGGTNTYTGNTSVNGGTLNLTGSWTGSTTSSTLAIGGTAGSTVTNVSGDITAFGFTGGAVNGAVAVYNQTAGLASFTGNNTTAVYVANNQGSYGYLNITGGTFKSAARFGIAQSLNVGIQSTGITYVGGTGILDLTNSEWALNYSHGHVTVAGNGLIDRSGATAPYGIIMNSNVSGGQYGVLNVAGGSFVTTTQPIRFGNSTTAGQGVNGTAFVNLAAGTLQVGTAMAASLPSAGSNKGYINFAGGTLKTSAAVANWIPTAPSGITLTSTMFGPIDNGGVANDFTGGLVFDSNGFNSSLDVPLRAAAGDGVAQSSLTVTPGTGYVGAPEVVFTGGTLTANGTPAAGYALISGGEVAGIVITAPGSYTAAPSVTLTGGGGTGASIAVGALVPNTSGGLTKTGAGILTLGGANTYSGPTLVSGGTLQLNGAAAGLLTTSSMTVGASGSLGFTAGSASTLDLTGKDMTLGGGTLAFDIGDALINDAITVENFALTANSAFSFTSIGAIGGTYTLVNSANPITNAGSYTISGQTIGRVTLTPTVNPSTITVTSSVNEGKWALTGGGNWSLGDLNATQDNWLNYKPTVAGDAALFGDTITAPSTVAVDTPHIVGYLRFDNANAYTIGANGSSNLTLNNGASNAVTTVTSGSHTIAENVLLLSHLDVIPATGTTLTVSGGISGAKNLELNGPGNLVLSGANTYTGTTVVSRGTLNVTGNTTGTGNVTVGNIVGNAVLNVPTGGSLIGTASGTSPTITLGTGGTGSSGALNITGGTVNLQGTETTDGSSFASSNGGYAAFFMSGGSFTQQRFMFGGTGTTTGAGGVGVGLQTGGTVNSTGWMIFGRAGASIGSYTITGGTLNHAGAAQDIAIGLQGTGRGELNVAGGLIDNTGKRVDFSGGTTGSFSWSGTGLLNLNAGTLLTNAVFYSSGTAYANFNGGTLKAAATNTSFMNAITTGGAYVNGAFGAFNGGAVIDSNGFDVTVAAALIAPTGDGVATIPVTSGGSGYIGAPAVSITDGGSGFGATAIANMVDDGTGNGTLEIDSITITNPGNDYTAPSVALVGGGNGVTAATLGALTTAANTSGGLTKEGVGTLTLSTANTYSGLSLVNLGSINLGNIDALGTTAAGTTLASGARVTFGSLTTGSTVAEPFVIAGTGTTATNGALNVGGNKTINLTGPITLSADARISTDGGSAFNLTNAAAVTAIDKNLTFQTDGSVASSITGPVSLGTGSLTKSGTSTLVLSGNNSFSGGTLLSGGVIQANHNNALGSNTVVITGTRLSVGNGITIANPITINANTGAVGRGVLEASAGTAVLSGPITINNGPPGGGLLASVGAAVLDIQGVITSSVGLSQRDGTVKLTGGGTGYASLVTTGTTIVGANNGIATTAAVGLGGSAAATLDLNGFNQSLVGITKVSTFAANIGNSSTTTDSVLTTTGTSSYAGAIVDVLGAGTRKVGLTVDSGDLTLTGANTYSGGTTVNQGTLTVGTGGTLGATTGELSVNNTNTGAGNDAILNLATAVNTTVGSLSGAIAPPSGGTNTATINTQTGRTFTVNQTSDASFAGTIAGAGDFILGGLSTNTLTLTGANTCTGTTTVSAGTLALVGGSHASPITVSSGAALDFTLGSPTTSTSTFNLSAGTIKITGTPTLPSYTLISSSTGITGTPVLHTPIAGYVLKKVGNTLVLENPYEAWAAANNATGGKTGDPDGDLIDNLTEYAFGTDPQSGVQGPITYSAGVVTAVGNPVVEEDAGVWYAVFGRRTDYVAAGLVYTVEFGAGLDQWTASVTVPTTVATNGVIDAVRVPFPNFVPTLSGPKKPTFFRVDISETP